MEENMGVITMEEMKYRFFVKTKYNIYQCDGYSITEERMVVLDHEVSIPLENVVEISKHTPDQKLMYSDQCTKCIEARFAKEEKKDE